MTQRIEPLQPPYEPQMAEMLAKWMPPGSDVEPLRLFRTLARHDWLFSRMRPLGAGILGHPRLDPRERELLILRTCARAGAEYEWGVHVVAFARPLGLSEQQIAASVLGASTDPVWSDADAQLIAAADALYDADTIPDELWRELSTRLRDDQLLELVIVAGWYRLISYVINAAGIEREPWAERFPAGDRARPGA
ncbi:MAG TPA: carboxymuconolactone decarboxylase family protein [Solirubrobacteraceae bacterium]|nr:carboxymuconolactone decarboxylase family protein [Solirubrobacteraceae bacterium]